MSPKQKKQSSFTLIELLVVIAIIGLLASIVAVILKQPREKARIAAGLQFSQTVHNALGSEIVGWWSFETITGNQTPDNSGLNNTGIINGAVAADGLTVPGGGTGQALSFNGMNNYVDIPSILGSQNTAGVTFSAWVKVNNSLDNAIIGGANNNSWSYYGSGGIWLDDGKPTMTAYDGASYKHAQAVNAISTNVWHYIVGTYDPVTDKLIVYVDGAQGDEETSANIQTSFNESYIGYNVKATNRMPFNGIIDEVRVYQRSLIAAEIQKHYAEGLKQHQILAMRSGAK